MAANRKYSTPAGIANPGCKKRPKVENGRIIMAEQNAADVERGVDASRRRFLGGTALTAVAAIIGGDGNIRSAFAQATARAAPPPAPAAPKGPQYLKFPGKNEKLVLLGDRPLVAETPESLLDDDTTPIEKFFIRNNGQIPEPAKDAEGWQLSVEGEVEKPLTLTIAELKSRFAPQTFRMVLEC